MTDDDSLEVYGLQFRSSADDKSGQKALIYFSLSPWIRWDMQRWNCDGKQNCTFNVFVYVLYESKKKNKGGNGTEEK